MAIHCFRDLRPAVGNRNGIDADLCLVPYEHESKKGLRKLIAKIAVNGYVDGAEYQREIRGWKEYEEHGLQIRGYTDAGGERICGYVEIDVFVFQRK